MKPSSQALIGGIVHTLEHDVLPDLDVSSWTASRLRSCLMVLKHLEERVVREGSFLAQDNTELRALLSRLQTDIAAVAPDASILAEIADVLASPSVSGSYPTIDVLTAQNEAYQAVLERAIGHLHATRRTLGEARFQEINGVILDYLRAAADREAPMFEAAAGLTAL